MSKNKVTKYILYALLFFCVLAAVSYLLPFMLRELGLIGEYPSQQLDRSHPDIGLFAQ